MPHTFQVHPDNQFIDQPKVRGAQTVHVTLSCPKTPKNEDVTLELARWFDDSTVRPMTLSKEYALGTLAKYRPFLSDITWNLETGITLTVKLSCTNAYALDQLVHDGFRDIAIMLDRATLSVSRG